MDAAIAGLIGAALGSGVTILKSVVDSYSAQRLEKAKAEWARAGVIDTELRSHVAAVARELLRAQHSMEWLCALTDENTLLDSKSVDTYHAEIHTTFPNLLGALATVASLNDRAWQDLKVLEDKVYAMDSGIAEALRSFSSDPKTTSLRVSMLRAPATELYKSLPKSINRIMRDLKQ